MERKSEKDGKLITALIAVQNELSPILANHENTFTGKKYLDLAEILRIARPILSKNGLLLQQFVDITENLATVNTEICNAEGESVMCGGAMGPTSMGKANATQMIGATITYLRRFQAMTILGIIGTEDDDEGEFRPRHGDKVEEETVQNGELNLAPEPDSIKDLRAAIQAIANEEVFTKAEALKIKESYMNARTLPELQKVLSNVQTAFTEKSGGSNE